MKTKHFEIKEFDCRDGTEVPKKYYPNLTILCEQLEIIRCAINQELKTTNVSLIILSGYRTKKYNKKVKGVSNSQHLYCKAADLVCRRMPAKMVHTIILRLIKEKKIKNGGVGSYNTFTHYDIGKPNRRW